MEHCKVAMCMRSSREPLGSHSQVLGHKCAHCSEKLQITNKGLAYLTENPDTLILCTSCGIRYSEDAKRRGKFAGVSLTEEAKKALETGCVVPEVAKWIGEQTQVDEKIN